MQLRRDLNVCDWAHLRKEDELMKELNSTVVIHFR